MGTRVRAGSFEELKARGCLTTKAGTQPVCVFWHEGSAYALDDRCPHMGFPLHRGTLESGLVTCHWHHARFDLASGGTLDPFADDVRCYPVDIQGDEVAVLVEPEVDRASHHLRRLADGLEHGLTLVTAKALLGLLSESDAEVGSPDVGSPEGTTGEVMRVGIDFGTSYRAQGWGAGLTVLVAMANVLPCLETEDRPLALLHGLAFVSDDTRGRPPRFPLAPLPMGGIAPKRLSEWYRRFIETRSPDAAERTLLSTISTADGAAGISGVARMMTAAATDHVFLDGGHTLDFTNKAFEALDHVGHEQAATVLPTLVAGTATASRAEESSQWRHPHDLVEMAEHAAARLGWKVGHVATGAEPGIASREHPSVATNGRSGDAGVTALAWEVLGDEPDALTDSLCAAVEGGMSPEQLGRAVAYAAALRMVRFHTQNDHADWDVVHHGFTAANALHQSLVRSPSLELLRGVLHGAYKVYLDRFLNVPAARPPSASSGHLEDLQACWDEQGKVDDAGNIAYGYLRGGGDPPALMAALGHALLAEDAEFHWFQTYEAAVRQFNAWPKGSNEGRLILAGAARFLAAHTPTRRELPQVFRIATRLRRGEALFEEE